MGVLNVVSCPFRGFVSFRGVSDPIWWASPPVRFQLYACPRKTCIVYRIASIALFDSGLSKLVRAVMRIKGRHPTL
ncbi:hypothetical protein E2C01_073335 [Portunus trituberculatus]|uniref:Uncharacterized protein n=1 Tax=Portunus trituberculatus TaxID=210409 RepID=A0A5B7IBF3_PORTR|nr:hypothetical protein [Portunus trituberculatus]